jgi:hypothetical protein
MVSPSACRAARLRTLLLSGGRGSNAAAPFDALVYPL